MSTRIRRWGVIGAAGTLLAVAASTAALAAPAAQTTPLVQTASNPSTGSILVNSAGMTLYINTAELGAAHLVCSGKCLTVWPPLTLPTGTTSPTTASGISGALGTTARPEGFSQVTYNGFPLYTFSKDSKPGDTHGNGIVALGGVWEVAFASSVPLSATPAARLTIRITSTGGTVWGTVAVSYTLGGKRVQQTCSSATCRLGVPRGVTLHLVETPKNRTSWPFQRWSVTPLSGRSRTATRSTLQLRFRADSTVSSIYRAA